MRKILLLIDCQNDFIDGVLGTEEAQKALPGIVEKVKQFNGDAIFYTLDTHYDNYLSTLEGKKLPVKHCIVDTPGWHYPKELVDAMIEKSNNCKLRSATKITFGADYLPGLVRGTFPDEDIEIEAIGFCTDICVISNVLILKAAFPEAKITVDSSCCAGVTPNKHEAALEVMRSCQIDVV